jgi:hypothetical protein
MEALKHEDKNDGRFWMPYRDFLRIFTTLDRCRVFDATWSVASSWIPYNVSPRSSGHYEFELSKTSTTVLVLSQPDTRYYGSFGSDFDNTLSFHVYDDEGNLVKRAKITVPYSKRSVSCELKLKPGKYTVIPHVIREPTDITRGGDDSDGEEENAVSPATRDNGVEVVVEQVKMDKSSYMFQQRKASLIRKMSQARVTGRTLLGVDDEDYEDENVDLDEINWQLMLGLRVYSHDANASLEGIPGEHPLRSAAAAAKAAELAEKQEEKDDPEGVTATLADKKELVAEPEQVKEE